VMADGNKGSKAAAEAAGHTGGNGEVQTNGSANGEAAREARPADIDPAETREWLDALEGVLETGGRERAR